MKVIQNMDISVKITRKSGITHRIVEKAKANVYATIILENSEYPKKLKFFFVDKITIIRSKFPDSNELGNVHPSLDIFFYWILSLWQQKQRSRN